jgi:hypothetical protein
MYLGWIRIIGNIVFTFPFSLHALRFSFVFVCFADAGNAAVSVPSRTLSGAVPIDAEGRRVGSKSCSPCSPVFMSLREFLYTTSPRLRITK